jgi:hypothetical protein
MIENRSFDHMLGFMKSINPAVDGLNGDEWNYPARELDPTLQSVRTPVMYMTSPPILTTISATSPLKFSEAVMSVPPICAASFATTTR